jgi:hypothetical protein
MNKKGLSGPYLNAGFIWAVIALIIIIIALSTGGAITIAKIFSFMSSLPGWLWVVLGIILLFRIVVGKRR